MNKDAISHDSGPIILLAEDDMDDQELLSEAFLKIDPSICLFCFPSGKKLISHLDGLHENKLPQMIILDFNIPEMSGPEILSYLQSRKKYDGVIKLVWSTSNTPLSENTSLTFGADGYFIKPSSISGINELARLMFSYIHREK